MAEGLERDLAGCGISAQSQKKRTGAQGSLTSKATGKPAAGPDGQSTTEGEPQVEAEINTAGFNSHRSAKSARGTRGSVSTTGVVARLRP